MIKKILLLILMVTLLFPFGTYAKRAGPELVTPSITSVEKLVSETISTSIEYWKVKEKIEYIYYHSETCGWCQKLNKFLEKNNAYEKLSITKIDVNQHAIEFNNVAENLWARPGTPFVTYEENWEKKYIEWGFYNIVDYFSKELSIDLPTSTPEENKSKRLYVILLGLLIIVGPLAYLGLKK